MSQSSKTTVRLSGSNSSMSCDDHIIVTSKLKVTGWDTQAKPLAWSTRFVLRGFEPEGQCYVELSAFNGKLSLERFRALTLFVPTVVYGWDPNRTNAKGEAAPGHVHTGRYLPLVVASGVEQGCRVLRVKKPSSFYNALERRLWKQAVSEWTRRKEVLFVQTDGDGVVVIERITNEPTPDGSTKMVREVRSLNEADFGAFLKRNGLGVLAAPKTDKRSALVKNLYGYSHEWLQGTSITLEAFGDNTNETREDGIVYVPEDVWVALAHSRDSGNPDNHSADRAHRSRMLKAHCAYIRIVTPSGTIKGEAIRCLHLPSGTIRFHRTNLKQEVRTTDGRIVVAMEPKQPKSHSRFHVQYYTTQRWVLGSNQDIRNSIFSDFFEVYEKAISGQLEVNLQYVIKKMTEDCTESEKSPLLQGQWAAWEWLFMGLKLTNSIGLSSFIWDSHTKFLVNWNKGKLSPRIPCTLRTNVFAWDVAVNAGLVKDTDAEPGFNEIRVLSGRLLCAVVSNARYEEMVQVHGSSDGDDDFDLLFRTISGERVVIVLRTPCGPGEYTVLSFIGDEAAAPASTVCQWNEAEEKVTKATGVTFPVLVVKDQPSRYVPGQVESKLGKAAARQTQEYGHAWIMESIANAVDNPSVGGFSNLIMLWASAHNGEAPVDMIAELSDVIDCLQQSGDKRQYRLISEWVDAHWLQMDMELRAGTITVDPYLWNTRSPRSVWNGTTRVEIGRFSDSEVEDNRKTASYFNLMSYCDRVSAKFNGYRDDAGRWIRGKFQVELAKAYTPHPVFALMAETAGEEEVRTQDTFYRDMCECVAELARTKFDSYAAKKAAFAELDAELEAHLLSGTSSEKNVRIAAFAAAVYRNQSLSHKDGMLFATPRVREAFMSVLRFHMAVWDAQQAAQADRADEMQAISDEQCGW